jgi:hypothetical protein
VQRRSREIDEGLVESIPADEVFARLEALTKKWRQYFIRRPNKKLPLRWKSVRNEVLASVASWFKRFVAFPLCSANHQVLGSHLIHVTDAFPSASFHLA